MRSVAIGGEGADEFGADGGDGGDNGFATDVGGGGGSNTEENECATSSSRIAADFVAAIFFFFQSNRCRRCLRTRAQLAAAGRHEVASSPARLASLIFLSSD
jgi:hypothetical protein